MFQRNWWAVFSAIGIAILCAFASGGQVVQLADTEQRTNPRVNQGSRLAPALGDRMILSAQSLAVGDEPFVLDGDELRLLMDIFPGIGSSRPGDFTRVGGLIYFTAETAEHGRELWRSDGTPQGTGIVHDIAPGCRGSNPTNLVAGGSHLFCIADDGAHGRELWRTDGTAYGTSLVGEVAPGPAGVPAQADMRWIDAVIWLGFGDFYQGGSGEVWRFDQAGAVPVAAGLKGRVYSFVPVQDKVFFVTGHITRQGLWVADAAGGGPRLVREYETIWGQSGASERTAFAWNGQLLFSAREFGAGFSMYLSDGTPEGTLPLRMPNGTLAPAASECFRDRGFILYSGSGEYGNELYRTDGTPNGTRLVANLVPDGPPHGPRGSNPRSFVRVGEVVYFVATINAMPTWFRTDGTQDGTVLVSEMSFPDSPFVQTVVSERVVFAAVNGLFAFDPARSDSTPLDTTPGLNMGSDFSSLGRLGERLILVQRRGGLGDVLWSTDGTPAGTRPILPLGDGVLVPTVADARAQSYAAVLNSGVIVFATSVDPQAGGELWRTDGTPEGTFRLLDINPGLAASSPSQLVTTGAQVFLVATEPVGGAEVWISDGTAPGTRRLRDIVPGPTGSSPNSLTVVGDRVFFGELLPSLGWSRLWVSDGTEAGTRVVPSGMAEAPELFIQRSTRDSWPRPLTAADGESLLLMGSTLSRQRESRGLWRTDGTVEGTSRIGPGPSVCCELEPRELTVWRGELYLAMSSRNSNPAALLKLTPTGGWETLLQNSFGNYTDESPSGFVSSNSLLYFYMPGQVWRTDSTPTGTLQLTPRADNINRYIRVPMVDVPGGVLFPHEVDGLPPTGAAELWISAGTPRGTRLIADIAPGTASSSPKVLGRLGNRAIFAADNGVQGQELFAMLFDGEPDCNGNGEPDWLDLERRTSRDANRDGAPDECRCVGDWDGDGAVAVTDLFEFLDDWFAGAADLDGLDGTDVADLFAFLSLYFTRCR